MLPTATTFTAATTLNTATIQYFLLPLRFPLLQYVFLVNYMYLLLLAYFFTADFPLTLKLLQLILIYFL